MTGEPSMEKSDFKILRKNRISFEMQHKTGDQYVVLYRSSLFYQDDFFIQGKNPITKNIDMDSLQAIAQYYYNKTLIEDFSTATRPFYFSRSKENLSFVDAAFNDIKKATNPDYISNYCFILLAEIASMKKTNQVKYFQALIPFLSNLNNGLNNEHEKLLTNFYQYSSLSDNIKKESLLAIAKSNYNFERGSYCYKQIVNMLCDFVDQKREDLRGALDKYSVFSSESSRADFLLEKYDGLGIIKKDLPLLLLARGKSEKLFSLVRNNPSCFLDYFQESGKAIELVRYLSLHGYHGCIKEMAQNLLPYIRHAKDYYALRVFLTDDEVLQIFKKLDETAKEKIDYLAFAYYDKESLTQQIKFRSYYYSYANLKFSVYTPAISFPLITPACNTPNKKAI